MTDLVTNVMNLVTLQMQFKQLVQNVEIDADLKNLVFTAVSAQPSLGEFGFKLFKIHNFWIHQNLSRLPRQ